MNEPVVPILRKPHRLMVLLALVVLMPAGYSPAQPATPPPVVPPDNGAHVSVTQRGTIELHVADLPLSTVLQMLSLETKRNIVASPKVQGKVTANLYNATFDEALQAVLVSNNAGFRQVGNFIYIYTNDELAELNAVAGKQAITRVIPLSYVSALDAQAYITPLLGKDGLVAVSPQATKGLAGQAEEGGGESNAGRNFIIVTARAENLREIERLLREVDVRPRQVLVEATILRAELKDDNALGIDFTIVGGVDLEEMGSISNGIRDLTVGNLPTSRLERFNSSTSTDFAKNVPTGGVTIGVIKDHVGAFLRALEEVTDTTVLANPKILALNKQKGQVIVGRRDGYLTTTVTETQAVQTVQFLETGTQLIFRPFIAEDGYVRVELHPEDSIGFVSAQGLPSEQTTEVTTNVVIRDGETILIGGLFRELTTDARSQIPGVGNIPGVGPLFRSNKDGSTREEVIILLTLHIVKDQDNYAARSQAIFEDIERTRVGVREGLMWHGRERLAQSHHRRAVEAMERGKKDKALWHANLALHCFPRHLPAIRLKESILGERSWEQDATMTRTFIHELIARDKGWPAKVFERPNPISSPADHSVPSGSMLTP
jgi:type IV pilus assembly protein PilQ